MRLLIRGLKGSHTARLHPLKTAALCSLLLSVGCTWQDAVVTAQELPRDLRLIDDVEVSGAQWKISTGNAVEFALSDDHGVPLAWLEAAQRGVQRVFPSQSPSAYRVVVDWPVSNEPITAEKQQVVKVGVLGFTHLPVPAKRQALTVRLHDASGRVVQRQQLIVRPAWFGDAWHADESIEHAFFTLAQVWAGH